MEYDSASRQYDVSTQPYDGYPAGTNPYNWKNATTWQNSLVFPAEQQYYGGPSFVPLYGGPTNWVFNPGMVNQSGQYVPTQGSNANLRAYDSSSSASATYSDASITYSDPAIIYSAQFVGGTPYDSAAFDYDGTNNGMSFANWKAPTAWTPIAGSLDF